MNREPTQFSSQSRFSAPPAWPFFVADGILVVLAAALIHFSEPGGRPVGTAAGLLVLGAIVFLIPYLLQWYANHRSAEISRWERLRETGGAAGQLPAEVRASLEEMGALAPAIGKAVEKMEKLGARIEEVAAALAQPTSEGQASENVAEKETVTSPLVEVADPGQVPESPVAKGKGRGKAPVVKELGDGLFSTTTLLATAFIGAGNRLFVRGEGPGLSWEKGTPMQFLEIGRWGWTTAEAAGPVMLRIYRNDVDEDRAGAYSLEPGNSLEVRPEF